MPDQTPDVEQEMIEHLEAGQAKIRERRERGEIPAGGVFFWCKEMALRHEMQQWLLDAAHMLKIDPSHIVVECRPGQPPSMHVRVPEAWVRSARVTPQNKAEIQMMFSRTIEAAVRDTALAFEQRLAKRIAALEVPAETDGD